MTWARTELPELPPSDDTGDDKRVDVDGLKDEYKEDPQEIMDLYKQAKVTPPKHIQDKIAAIKQKEQEERERELAEQQQAEGEPGEQNQAEKEAPAEVEPEEAEEKQEEAEEEKEEENPEEEPPVEDEDYGIEEANYLQRRPHPSFRDQHETENNFIAMLNKANNITGCIVTPGLVYGFGESQLCNLFKNIWLEKVDKAPLYYGGHKRVIPTIHTLDLALLIH